MQTLALMQELSGLCPYLSHLSFSYPDSSTNRQTETCQGWRSSGPSGPLTTASMRPLMASTHAIIHFTRGSSCTVSQAAPSNRWPGMQSGTCGMSHYFGVPLRQLNVLSLDNEGTGKACCILHFAVSVPLVLQSQQTQGGVLLSMYPLFDVSSVCLFLVFFANCVYIPGNDTNLLSLQHFLSEINLRTLASYCTYRICRKLIVLWTPFCQQKSLQIFFLNFDARTSCKT